ncbi:fused MFS/spermidine synthase [Agreia pratensis]|uniref:spermidine synthase n=1 Tax=Agreia pratensis TaxID=150121 RepID=UPI001889D4A0|nr:fused MFS/spermidine synthase [Agreia pratensis]MBF4635381.1 fused MFS/spermidine synthase [Agreia pratensis]
MSEAVERVLPSKTIARLTPDPFVAGALNLSLDSVPQSHVSLRDPRHLFYDYMRRMGTAIDLAARAAEPITVLHLGAGALTLARYVAETRPGSRQLAVEGERGLVPFVLEEAPLPRSAAVDLIESDALDALETLAAVGSHWRARADVVVCDVYSGLETPAHLVTPAFFTAVHSILAPGGTVLVNVADDADLARSEAQIAAMSAVFPRVAMIGPSALLDGREAGNIVLLAGSDPAIVERMPSLAAAGPHPVAWRVA